MRKHAVAGWTAAVCLASVALASCSSGSSSSSPAPDSGAGVEAGEAGSGLDSSAGPDGDAAREAQVEAGNPDDYLDKPLRDQVTALESGIITSAGLTAAYLARIATRDKGDGGVHAILLNDPQAVTHATTLDGERGKGALLQGADILVKDNIDTQGIATTAGSLALASNVPTADAFVIQRIHGAQGLMFGKTNLSEWANFRSTTATSGWSSVGGQTYMGRNTAYESVWVELGVGGGRRSGPRLRRARIGDRTDRSCAPPRSTASWASSRR